MFEYSPPFLGKCYICWNQHSWYSQAACWGLLFLVGLHKCTCPYVSGRCKTIMLLLSNPQQKHMRAAFLGFLYSRLIHLISLFASLAGISQSLLIYWFVNLWLSAWGRQGERISSRKPPLSSQMVLWEGNVQVEVGVSWSYLAIILSSSYDF